MKPAIPAAPTRNAHMPPDNYVPLVVIAIFLCCPLGFVALVHCLRVKRYWQAGEREAARHASLSTRRWAVAAILVPVLLFAAIMVSSAFGLLKEDMRVYEDPLGLNMAEEED